MRGFSGAVWVGAAFGAAVVVACGAPSGGVDDGSQSFGGSSGSGAGTGTGGAGNSGSGGSGNSGSGGSGNSGGSISFDAGNTGGSAGLQSDAACTGVTQQSQAQRQPADIIFILDNSCSMSDEADSVQRRMNDFSSSIEAAGIDSNVVVISSYPGNGYGICIDPPLGSGGCPTTDTNPATGFLHVDEVVNSNDGLEVLLRTWPEWQGAMRPGALKHVVIVTDDESDLGAASFDQQFRALDPMLAGYKFHGVFGFINTNPPTAGGQCPIFGSTNPCCDLIAAQGAIYAQLVAATGGVSGDICLQDPAFVNVFARVSESVITGSGLACEWVIPPPPNGEQLDPNKVNVDVSIGGQPQGVGYVTDPSQCGTVPQGWYYDNPSAPARIFVCPQTCDLIKNSSNGVVDIELGCATEVAVPE